MFHECVARSFGKDVRSSDVWTGPVPEDSFIDLSPWMRMARPEYMFFRKCTQWPEHDAMMLLVELLGPYTTELTNPNVRDGEARLNLNPHTTLDSMYKYLVRTMHYEEGVKAFGLFTKFIRNMNDFIDEYLSVIDARRIVNNF